MEKEDKGLSHSMLDVIFHGSKHLCHLSDSKSHKVGTLIISTWVHFFWIPTVKCQKRHLFSLRCRPLLREEQGNTVASKNSYPQEPEISASPNLKLFSILVFLVITLLLIWTGSAQLNFNAWGCVQSSSIWKIRGRPHFFFYFSVLFRKLWSDEINLVVFWNGVFFSYSNFKNPLVDFCINRHC